jgi:hypothetical protein
MNQYNPQSWFDGASGGTPLEAARMNVAEAGIADASATAYATAAALGQVPGDSGYAAWSSDPAAVGGTSSLTAGVVYLQKIVTRGVKTITNLHCAVAATGTMTAAQNFLAVFDLTGTRLAVTADITAALAAVGEVKAALTAALVNLAAGTYYLGLLPNGSPMATFARGGPVVSGLGNANATAGTQRAAVHGTAQTTMPTSLTMSSLANTGNAPWLAAS